MKKQLDISSIIENEREHLTLEGTAFTDHEVLKRISEDIFESDEFSQLDARQIEGLIERIFLALRRDLYILDPLKKDDEITEIMVNGIDDIYIEKKGELIRTELSFESKKALMDVIRRIASMMDREINELNPIVDAKLSDGSRVNAVYDNIALNGPILTIRRFPKAGYSMDDLISFETLNEECAEFLKVLVEAGYNIFVSGGTSSGKTTFLNVLSEFIPKDQRVITIEDSAELAIRGIDNLVRLECRKSNSEGKGSVNMTELIKTSLRMRPDRIIVGEVRGGEVVDMINAMNTGHDGSLSTGHGNSVMGMLRRLESMFLQEAKFPMEAIRGQISEGIDVIVHLGRLAGGKRKVLEVAEIAGIKNGEYEINTLFTYKPGKGLIRTNNKLSSLEKLRLHGGDYEAKI